MLSVVIPTLNASEKLGSTLAALVPAAVDGVVRDVVIVDGGSEDDTRRMADEAGATVVTAARGRGTQLAAGARSARSNWLLFLHADTVLEPGWYSEVAKWVRRSEADGRAGERAAAFRFALDDDGARPRFLETMVGLRCALFRLPYGDQGLLVHRSLYDEIGGYRDLPLMEDVDIVRRLGRRRLCMLRSRAITSASRFRRDGYLLRSSRNLGLLLLFYLRVPPRVLARLYE